MTEDRALKILTLQQLGQQHPLFFFFFFLAGKTNETLNRWEIGIQWNPFELKKIFAHVKSQSKISHQDVNYHSYKRTSKKRPQFRGNVVGGHDIFHISSASHDVVSSTISVYDSPLAKKKFACYKNSAL